MNQIDARGLSCPEPVVMLRKAMMTKEDAYEIMVDNTASKENVTRYARNLFYKFICLLLLRFIGTLVQSVLKKSAMKSRYRPV